MHFSKHYSMSLVANKYLERLKTYVSASKLKENGAEDIQKAVTED